MDVEETMFYLAREASEPLAIRWQHAVKHGVDKIIQNPERSHLRRDLKPDGVRAVSVPPFHKHLIFYRWSDGDNELEFYRVRHGAMNLPLLFEFGSD